MLDSIGVDVRGGRVVLNAPEQTISDFRHVAFFIPVRLNLERRHVLPDGIGHLTQELARAIDGDHRAVLALRARRVRPLEASRKAQILHRLLPVVPVEVG